MKDIFVDEALSAATSFPITYMPKTKQRSLANDSPKDIYLDMSILD